MENLTITKEKVLEAAAKCETAKRTLEVLFPEVFESNQKRKELVLLLAEWINHENHGNYQKTPGSLSRGKAEGIVNHLTEQYNWKF